MSVECTLKVSLIYAIIIMQTGLANKNLKRRNILIVYFETQDSESLLSMAHSVYVTPDDEFSLSVIKNKMSDHCLMLSVSGSKYVIERSSDWLDNGHDSFYWKARVLSSFNRIVKRFGALTEGAVTRKGSGIIDIASLINDEYSVFEQTL